MIREPILSERRLNKNNRLAKCLRSSNLDRVRPTTQSHVKNERVIVSRMGNIKFQDKKMEEFCTHLTVMLPLEEYQRGSQRTKSYSKIGQNKKIWQYYDILCIIIILQGKLVRQQTLVLTWLPGYINMFKWFFCEMHVYFLHGIDEERFKHIFCQSLNLVN